MLTISTVKAGRYKSDEGLIKPMVGWRYADLALNPSGPLGRIGLIERHLSLKPYWGKLNVRNFREDAGNVSDGWTGIALRNRKSEDRKLPA